MSNLTSQQSAFVSAKGPAVALAAPGTGKTTTAVARLQRMAYEGPYRLGGGYPDMLALSFTNAAAAELAKRLRALDEPCMERVRCSTIHAEALRILRGHAGIVGYRAVEGRRLAVRDDDQVDDIIRGAITALCLGKDRHITVSAVRRYIVGHRTGDLKRDGKLAVVAAQVERELIDQYAVAMDRIVPLATRVLNSIDPGYGYVLVDEAQDLSDDQWDFLAALELHGATVEGIGDIDQSIYRWRDAQPKRFLQFASRDDVSVFPMTTTFRCHPEICEAANKLIAHNTERLDGQPPMASWEGYKRPTFFVCPVVELNTVYATQYEEAEYVTSYAKAVLDAGHSVAILGRNHRRLAPIMAELSRIKCPWRSTKKAEATPQERRLLDLLRLVNDTTDDFLTERLVNADAHRLDSDQIHQAKMNAAAHHRTLLEELVAEPRSSASMGWAKQVFEYAAFEAGLEDRDIASSIEIEYGKAPSLREAIVAWAAEKEWRLSDFIDALDSGAFQWPPEPSVDEAVVTVSTIHSAKGLEWDAVVVLGLEAGQFPKGRDIEEERRLAYVAITRARHEVALTRMADSEPSRFLSEMGAWAASEELEWRDVRNA